MDRARQDWVYEYAETGRPLAARSLHGSRSGVGESDSSIAGAGTRCKSRRSNGPAGKSGPDGHKLSVIGSPQPAARSACFHRHPHWFAALREGPRDRGHSSSISPVIRPSIPLPIVRVPSDLAACTDSHRLPDGKVRWQRKFVFPARRMRRGLRFLKTINSRKSTTNAKTSTPSRVPFITDALRAFCPACSRHLSTWGWSATRSST